MFFAVELLVRYSYFINIYITIVLSFIYVVFAGISAPLSSFNVWVFLFFDVLLFFFIFCCSFFIPGEKKVKNFVYNN